MPKIWMLNIYIIWKSQDFSVLTDFSHEIHLVTKFEYGGSSKLLIDPFSYIYLNTYLKEMLLYFNTRL